MQTEQSNIKYYEMPLGPLSMGSAVCDAEKADVIKEALKNPSHSQCSPDAAMVISWLGRRNGGFSEAPKAI